MVLCRLYCQTICIKYNYPANLHGGGALHDHVPVSASYTVPCRYALLCHPSQAYFFPCITNWFDSNHPFQTQTIR